MRQPSHDELVGTQQLHPVDAKIHAGFFGATSDDQWPRDERSHVTWPAGLDRQGRKINVITPQNNVLAWRSTNNLRPHVQHFFEQRCFVDEVAHAFGRIGLSQIGE